MRCIIEVRDKELYVLVGKKAGKGINVSNAFRIFLADSLITDKGVKTTPELVNRIKGILKEQKVKIKSIDLVINHRAGLTKDITVPKVDSKKLDLLVTHEMVALFNLTRDYVIDYRILGVVNDGGISKYRVLASAMSTQVIAGLEEFFKELKMKINSINTAVSSFLDFVGSTNLIPTDEPIVLIDASTSYLRYYLFENKEFVLVRSVYVKETDDLDAVSDRAYHLLELMSQSRRGLTGKEIKRVQLMGLKERFAMICAHCNENADITVEVSDLSKLLKDKSDKLLDYGNSLGMLK